PSPVLSRWGGEEFALARILDDPAGTHEALQLLAAAVPDAQTCSIGYAIWDGVESAESLMSRVDHELYRAKMTGRNTIHGHG
ncbi:MAG: diguanylate cyclase, partial [Williamsia herbipolensis]|nr:diguanylate cyclase [Williamsia herbipolensis]